MNLLRIYMELRCLFLSITPVLNGRLILHDKTKNPALHSNCHQQPWRQTLHKIPCVGENHEKWTAMYWFAHKAYSAVILGWIRLRMKRLKDWWLSGLEILLAVIPTCFPYFHIRSPMLHLLFPQFLWVFFIFPDVSPCFLF